MALTIIFMASFSLVLAIRNYKNKYNLLFIMMVFGMTVSMFTIVSEIYRSSNYQVPSSFVYSGIEYNLFLLFSKLMHLPLSDLQKMRNLGIITYFIGILLFANAFNKNVLTKNPKEKPARNIIQYTVLASYLVIYYIFYHPDTAFTIYLIGHRLSGNKEYNLWINFISVFDIIMTLFAFAYIIFPVAILIRSHFKNKISFLSEQLIGLAISISLLNTLFFFVFFTGAFQTSVQDVFNYGFWHYKLAVVVPRYYATVLPLLSLLILLAILFITYRFKTSSMFNGLKQRAIKRNLNILNNNLKDVLHSNKNIMFNLKILSEEALLNYGTPEGKRHLEQIKSLSVNHMNSITKALNNIRELKVSTYKNNLIDAIEGALEEINIPEDIEITKTYHDTEVYGSFDMYHMKHVVINIITNAIDAIYSKNTARPQIDITVNSSLDWIYFSIKDNGCGIPKKSIKKIISPYYSTKSKQYNWGIGLSYVFRIITAHYGHMKIRSKLEEFTKVEILLPRSTQKGRKHG